MPDHEPTPPHRSGAQRRSTPVRVSAAIRAAESRRRRRVVGLTIALLLLVGILGRARGWWLVPHHEIPPHLVGVWGTSHVRYLGRTLELQPRQVVFRTTDAAPGGFGVRTVRRRRVGTATEFVIIGEGDGVAASTLSLEYDGAARVLRLKNLPDLEWRRVR